MKRLLPIILLATMALSGTVKAGAISVDDSWREFGFGNVGLTAGAGFNNIWTGATVSQLDAGPWTFSGPAVITILDAFFSGDQFELFDFGVSQGITSATNGSGGCVSDVPTCLANLTMSRGSFSVGAGAHSLTIGLVVSPHGGGAALLRASAVSVSEPVTLLLLSMGLLGLGIRRKVRFFH